MSRLKFPVPILIICAVISVLTACGNPAGNTQSVSAAAKVSPDRDMAIMQALYFDHRTPAGFYQAMPTNNSNGFYSVSQVKNTDIVAPSLRKQQAQYELSSNDYTQAMHWSVIANGYQSANRQLVDVSSTNLYFQFTWVAMNKPNVSYYSRVFKLGAIDRSGVDLSVPEVPGIPVYMGKIPLSSVSATQLQTIVEYLWWFGGSNNFGHAVIATSPGETAAFLTEQMTEARLTQSHTGQCDQISVYRVNYSLDKSTGKIMKITELLRQFAARRDGAQVRVCS